LLGVYEALVIFQTAESSFSSISILFFIEVNVPPLLNQATDRDQIVPT